jgi:hypothetical protein
VALTTVMNENEDLISRLRAFGRRPVDTDLATGHLAAIAAASGALSRPRTHRLRVVAAFTVGLLAGTSGLATAGALPNGAQEIAHRTLGSVGVNVPHGDRYQGPECGGEVKNHGQYVKSQPKGSRATAAASRCGKPLQAGTGDDGSGKATGCQGPPPWAGKGKPDQAAKDARKAACGNEQDGDEKAGNDQKADSDAKEAPAPAAGAVTGLVPLPETTPTSATTTSTTSTSETTSTSATTSTTLTTVTTAPQEDTTTTTATVPVPGLGS